MRPAQGVRMGVPPLVNIPIAILVMSGAAVACSAPATSRAEMGSVVGYIVSLPDESPADREARHRRISARREGPIVIVHRGASAFAPENTLEAFAAAMDYGADGCEIDIRRTADGVLVLFHDDGLDRMVDAVGRINQYAFHELAALTFRSIYEAKPETRIPTLAAAFELARQRTMLLHLDVKEPGLEADIARLLDAADIWDHVVEVNESNASMLRKHPRLNPLRYKIFGLQEGRLDMDPERIREGLRTPGHMILVDDPRVASLELGRSVHPVPLPENLRAPLAATRTAVMPVTNAFSPPRFLQGLSRRVDARSLTELGRLLTAHFPGRTDLEGDGAYQERRAARIVERAWAADRIGRLERTSRRAVTLLEQQLQHRSLHRDWAYHGLDGVMAARALGALHSTASVPLLARTFFAIDPELRKMVQPPADYPYAWSDFQVKREIVATLGELPCGQSKRFLLDYLAMDKAAAGRFAPPLFEDATRSLLRQRLSRHELQQLLRSTNSAIRGTAILECLDRPSARRRAAMKTVVPWTHDLP